MSLDDITPDNIKVPDAAEWYTPQEVGKLFRVDPKTVVRWESSGMLEKYKVRVARTLGNHRRYNRDDINRLFDELNRGPAE